MKKTILAAVIATLASPAYAAVVINVTVDSFGAIQNSDAAFAPSGTSDMGTTFTTTGSTIPAHTYHVSGVDLTSIGGTANETIDFAVNFTATTDGTSTSPGFSWGYMDVGGPGIQDNETLTATIGTISTTFAGGVSKISVVLNSVIFSSFTASESTDVTTASGTVSVTGGTGDIQKTFANSSFVTAAPTVGALGFQGYTFEITAVPEPSTTALFGLAGLGLIVRRRR